MAEFFIRLKIKFRRLINYCPRRLRVFGGPLLGGLVGLIGGIPGFFIGILLGYLLRELFVQSFRDRNMLDYFVDPGPQQFYEGEPGLAAWCALAVLVVSENSAETTVAPESYAKGPAVSERIIKQVILGASCVFAGPLADPFLMEHFARLALSCKDSLNPDLLAESFAAKRTPLGDAGGLGRCLGSFAEGEKARSLVREIRIILDPGSINERDPENSGPGMQGLGDPWKILGLPPGTPLKEVKSHYRRLAKQFHPDELAVLDERRRETAALAFMAIKEAYQEVAGT